jgi:phage N-6-adenine-methyltransferase
VGINVSRFDALPAETRKSLRILELFEDCKGFSNWWFDMEPKHRNNIFQSLRKMLLPLSKGGKVRDKDPRRDEWQTPPDVFIKLNNEFDLSIDVAANIHNRKSLYYFGPDQQDSRYRNCLEIDWVQVARDSGLKPSFWMNPPYSKVDKFIRKAYEESQKGASVVCLVAPTVSAKWWHEIALKGEIRWIKGRIDFIPPPGIEASTNTRDSAIVIFRPNR